MTRAEKTLWRQAQRDQALLELERCSHVDVDALDERQRWLLFAALNLVTRLAAVPLLLRLIAYLLCHCGLGLKAQVIASAVAVSTRARSSLRKAEPTQLLNSLRRAARYRNQRVAIPNPNPGLPRDDWNQL